MNYTKVSRRSPGGKLKAWKNFEKYALDYAMEFGEIISIKFRFQTGRIYQEVIERTKLYWLLNNLPLLGKFITKNLIWFDLIIVELRKFLKFLLKVLISVLSLFTGYQNFWYWIVFSSDNWWEYLLKAKFWATTFNILPMFRFPDKGSLPDNSLRSKQTIQNSFKKSSSLLIKKFSIWASVKHLSSYRIKLGMRKKIIADI